MAKFSPTPKRNTRTRAQLGFVSKCEAFAKGRGDHWIAVTALEWDWSNSSLQLDDGGQYSFSSQKN